MIPAHASKRGALRHDTVHPDDVTLAVLPALVLGALAPDLAAGGVGGALRDAAVLVCAGINLGARAVGAAAPLPEPSGADRAPVQLSAIAAQASAHLAAFQPTGAGWLASFASSWATHARAFASAARPSAPFDAASPGARVAPLGALCLVAAEAAGRPDLVAELAPLFDDTAAVYLGVLQARRARVDAADGVADPEDRTAWKRDDVCAGTVASGWRRLGFDAVGALIDGWAAARADGPAAPARATRPRDDAVRAGRAALDDGASVREARELYRWGFLEVNPLVSTVFPDGTILENRLRAGEARPGAVDALLRRYAANRFHYFDQPSSLPFDTDTFGLLARLARWATDPAEARRALDEPLGWVVANIGPDGDVPVFLTRGVHAGDGRRYIETFGNGCAGVQANLVLGLLALGDPRPEQAIRRVGAHLCARFAAQGVVSLAHYDALYGAYLVREAVDGLRAAGLDVPAEAARARAVAAAIITRACGSERPSALELAWLLLATQAADARPLRRPEWRAALLAAQESDGGWAAAPFYRVPSRGNFGETYASRAVTTSFVCLALTLDDGPPPAAPVDEAPPPAAAPVGLADPRQGARAAFGSRVSRALSPLFGEDPIGSSLVFDLEPLRAPSGRWEDLGVLMPGGLMDLPVLALHDLGAAGPAVASVPPTSSEAPTAPLVGAGPLLDAAALSLVAIFLAEATVGAESGHDAPSALLLGSLASLAVARAHAVDGAGGSARFADAWRAHADAMGVAGRRRAAWTEPGPLAADALIALGRRHAPLTALFTQALREAGRPDLDPTLTPAIEEVAGLYQLLCDLDAGPRDLARGWWSPVSARLAAAVGALPSGDAPPPTPQVMLAAVVTGVVPSLAREGAARVRALAETFAGAGLTRVAERVAGLASPFEAVARRYEPGATAPTDAPPVAFRVSPQPRRAQAITSLRAALDDDPECREAWVTWRSGRDGKAPERDDLSGPATIVENRVRAGERRTADIDRLIRALVVCERLEVDALGALARLVPYAADPREAQALLSAPLARARDPHTIGSMSLWVGVDGRRGPACAGVLARLALGLLTWPDPPADAPELAAQALTRVASQRAAAFGAHDPLHGALLTLELAELAPGPSAAGATAWAVAFASRGSGRARTSPLAAAWLWLLTARPAARALRDPSGYTTLLRAQRASGTWDGGVMLRDHAAEGRRPASRLLTTSFVYRALALEDHQMGGRV